MERDKWKTKALTFIRTAIPNPCVVTLVIVAVGWLFSALTQRIPATPLYLDLQAMQKMDMENAIILDWSRVTPFGLSLFAAFEILLVILDFGYVRYTLNVSREIQTGYADLLSGFKFPFRAFLLALLEGMIELLLFYLLIIPGVIAMYNYSMARRLLCDHPDWSPVRCLQESRRMMKGHRWELFEIHLSFLPWFLLMIFRVTAVFVKPYYNLTVNEFYRSLCGEETIVVSEDEDDSSFWM